VCCSDITLRDLERVLYFETGSSSSRSRALEAERAVKREMGATMDDFAR